MYITKENRVVSENPEKIMCQIVPRKEFEKNLKGEAFCEKNEQIK